MTNQVTEQAKAALLDALNVAIDRREGGGNIVQITLMLAAKLQAALQPAPTEQERDYLPPNIEHALNHLLGNIEGDTGYKNRPDDEKEYIAQCEATIRAALSRPQAPINQAADLFELQHKTAQHCARMAQTMNLDMREGFELGIQAFQYLASRNLLVSQKPLETENKNICASETGNKAPVNQAVDLSQDYQVLRDLIDKHECGNVYALAALVRLRAFANFNLIQSSAPQEPVKIPKTVWDIANALSELDEYEAKPDGTPGNAQALSVAGIRTIRAILEAQGKALYAQPPAQEPQ